MNSLHSMEQFLFDNLGDGTTLLQINADDCPPTEVLIEADVWDREERPHLIKITDPSTENNVSLRTVFKHVKRIARREPMPEVWSDEPTTLSKRKKRRSAPVGSVIEVPIDEITVKKRIRKDNGDLKELAESIKNDGLLQPIGVDYKMTLIFGHRRLIACRDLLGWRSIPVRVLEVGSILDGEIAENIMRKDFTVSERVAIGNLIEKQMPERRGKSQKFSYLKGRTDEIAAKRAGFGNRQTYRQAKKIIESCTSDVIDAVDKGILSISAAFVLVEQEPDLQNTLLKENSSQKRFTSNGIKKQLRQKTKRHPEDWYRTPTHATEQLLEHESFQGLVWECACGDGIMSEVLVSKEMSVYSSDLVDRGYGDTLDFLESSKSVANVITNPPYRLAEQFILHALEVATSKVAMLLPLTFLAGQYRYQKIWKSSPFSVVYVFSARLSMCRGDIENKRGGKVDYAWFVWDHNTNLEPVVKHLSS